MQSAPASWCSRLTRCACGCSYGSAGAVGRCYPAGYGQAQLRTRKLSEPLFGEDCGTCEAFDAVIGTQARHLTHREGYGNGLRGHKAAVICMGSESAGLTCKTRHTQLHVTFTLSHGPWRARCCFVPAGLQDTVEGVL